MNAHKRGPCNEGIAVGDFVLTCTRQNSLSVEVSTSKYSIYLGILGLLRPLRALASRSNSSTWQSGASAPQVTPLHAAHRLRKSAY